MVYRFSKIQLQPWHKHLMANEADGDVSIKVPGGSCWTVLVGMMFWDVEQSSTDNYRQDPYLATVAHDSYGLVFWCFGSPGMNVFQKVTF